MQIDTEAIAYGNIVGLMVENNLKRGTIYLINKCFERLAMTIHAVVTTNDCNTLATKSNTIAK
jgi:hypothetical protein